MGGSQQDGSEKSVDCSDEEIRLKSADNKNFAEIVEKPKKSTFGSKSKSLAKISEEDGLEDGEILETSAGSGAKNKSGISATKSGKSTKIAKS